MRRNRAWQSIGDFGIINYPSDNVELETEKSHFFAEKMINKRIFVASCETHMLIQMKDLIMSNSLLKTNPLVMCQIPDFDERLRLITYDESSPPFLLDPY